MATGDIDRFVLAKLEAVGWHRSAQRNRHTLLAETGAGPLRAPFPLASTRSRAGGARRGVVAAVP